MPRRTVGPRLLRQTGLAPALALGLIAGCFSTDAVEGLPCSTDATCGPDHTCAFGRCRPLGTDAQARCGDGMQEQGEFCYFEDQAIQVPISGMLRDASWADLDGDGDIDSVTVSDMITVNINTGNGMFDSDDFTFSETRDDLAELGFPIEFLEPDEDIGMVPTHVTVGNFAGNEFVDLIFVIRPADEEEEDEDGFRELLSAPLWLAENLGDGEVGVRPLVETADISEYTIETAGLRSGDFNGDGWDDVIAVTDADEDNLMGEQLAFVMLNDQAGELGEPFEVPQGGRGLPVIADINGDNSDDLVTPDMMMQTVSVVLGPMTLDRPGSNPIRFTASGSIIAIEAADLNGDGNLDLVTALGESGFEVWLGDGSGEFEASSLVSDQRVADVIAADLDADGAVDLVSGGINGLFVHPGYGDGSYGAGFLLSESVAAVLEPIELNGDGITDLVVVSQNLVALHVGQP